MKPFLLGAAIALATLAAQAQPPGPGPGPGPRGGPRFGADVTPGWALMTPAERQAHQEKMRGMKDSAECQAYMAEHHKLMQQRAQEKGKSLPWKGSPGRGCSFLSQPTPKEKSK